MTYGRIQSYSNFPVGCLIHSFVIWSALHSHNVFDLDAVDDDDEDPDEIKTEKQEKDDKMEETMSPDTVQAVTAANNSPTIDNPYLRAAKIPKKIKAEI